MYKNILPFHNATVPFVLPFKHFFARAGKSFYLRLLKPESTYGYSITLVS